tara:strand:+ start:71084 stop:72256 length:1173 start_codon:yes stop_codon:yes gene_type:complete
MHTRSPQTRNGSVYLVTLITVGAIVSMVFIGLNMRLLLNSQTDIVTEMSTKSARVFDAAELAIEHIASDEKWKISAQDGIVFSDLKLDDTIYRGTVLDAGTSKAPDNDTTNYQVRVEFESGTAWAGAQFEVERVPFDYKEALKSFDPVFYWPLNEPPDTRAVEEGFKNQRGAHQSRDVPGASTNDAGEYVPVFQAASDHIEVPYDNSMLHSEATISLWMKIDSKAAETPMGVIGMLYGNRNYATIDLSIKDMGFYAYTKDNGSMDISNFAISSSDILEVDRWYHVAMSWGSEGLRVYLDGVRVAYKSSNRDGVGTNSILNGGRQPLHIGGGFKSMYISNDELGFHGSIAHVAFIDPQLTDRQVQELAAIRPDTNSYELVESSWVRVFNDE